MSKVRFIYLNRRRNILAIQCRRRRKLAKRVLRRLKKEANESGALRLAKSKLEKLLEDLTWRLHLERKIKVSNEDAKSVKISKLQKTLDFLTLELDAAKLRNEYNKNMVLLLQRQLDLSAKEESSFKREKFSPRELRNENSVLKSSLAALEEKNSMLESQLTRTKEETNITIPKLQEVEKTCLHLQQNLQSMEEKLSNLENGNQILQSSLAALEEKNSMLESELTRTKEETNSTIPKLQEVEKTCLQLQQNLQSMEEKLSNLENGNHILQSSLAALEEKNSMLESELTRTKEETNSTIAKLQEVEKTCLQLQQNLQSMEEKLSNLENGNHILQSSLAALEEKNSMLESELIRTKEEANSTISKLQEVDKTCLQLQQNLRSMEEKLSNLENENHFLRQKTLSATPRSNWSGLAKPFLDKFTGALVIQSADQKSYESPTQSNIAPISKGFSDTRRANTRIKKHQGNLGIISRCIKENLGFKDGKPVAACVMYKCLLHWHAFESESTAIFDFIIERINDELKEGKENDVLPYWLSNTSALLCLLQRNQQSNGFLTADSQCSAGSVGPNGRLVQGPRRSSFKYHALDDDLFHIEAKSPAIFFKQKLTASVEKIFGLICDNLKKELHPLLGQCIQAPISQRLHGITSSRSWDSIIKFLNSLKSRFRGNYVPSFFIRKLTTQVFSFINIQLFNSLLLRRECCTFQNGEYIKSGLAELEKWIVNATEEFAGTSWHELNYIRQAAGFLVILQKREMSFKEIRQVLCPKLTVRQIYRISTMYWDDKYGTQSVSSEVLSQMMDIVYKDSLSTSSSSSFLLDDDLSIPFSTEDVYMAIPAIDPSDIEPPKFFSEYPSAQMLLQNVK